MDWYLQLVDGLRMVGRALKVNISGLPRYKGSVKNICNQIIEKCYDSKKNYFRVSSGHFCQFYARDFGMVCSALIKLGYKEKARSTLDYAMQMYEKAGRITTQISPDGKPFDFPLHTPESASYMLNGLLLLNDKALINRHKDFFERLAKKIFEEDVDKETGLLRKDKHFSSMKDHSMRVSDCYNNCLLGLFAANLKKAKIKSELSKYDYPKLIVKYFWTGSYFREDLSGRDIISGDANTFPFWTGLVTDKKMFVKALKSIQSKKLDEPWPLRYTAPEDVPKNLHAADMIAYGYEHDTVWMHLGLCFLDVVEKYDKKLLKKYMKEYEKLIVKHGNFLELYFPDGEPFRRLLYVADDSMIWVASFLAKYSSKN